MKCNKSIKKNALMSGINKGITLVFPIITFAYVSRIIGVTNYGKYNYSQSIYSYFSLLSGLGISSYAIREGVKYRDNPKKISEFASEMFSINMVMTVLAYLALAVLLLVSPSLADYRICILICSIAMLFSVVGVEWLFSIYEDYTYITVRNAIFKVISFIMLFLFVRHEEDYLNYAAICVFASAGSSIFNYFRAKKICNVHFVVHNKFKCHIKALVIFAGINIAVYIYNSSDITMLGIFADDEAVGLYSAASKIYRVAKSVILAIVTVAIPRLTFYANRDDGRKFKSLLGKIIRYMNFFMMPLIIMIILEGENVLLIISGAEYLSAYHTLAILTLAIACSMYAWISSQCVLVPYGKENENLYSTLLGAALNILLNFILIPKYGAEAAAFTTILAEAFVAVYCTVKAKKLVKFRFFEKDFISVLFGCIVMVAIGKIFNVDFNNVYYTFMLNCFILSATYIAITFLMRNACAVEIISIIKNRIKPF